MWRNCSSQLPHFDQLHASKIIYLMGYKMWCSWLTSGFANVMERRGARCIVPFPSVRRRPPFCATLKSTSVIVRLAFTPVSITRSCSVKPQPAWSVFGIPVQSHPCALWYFGGKCFLFSLWIHHDKRRSHYYTGGFCGIPAQGFGWDLVTRTLQIDPIVWTNPYEILNVR